MTRQKHSKDRSAQRQTNEGSHNGPLLSTSARRAILARTSLENSRSASCSRTDKPLAQWSKMFHDCIIDA